MRFPRARFRTSLIPGLLLALVLAAPRLARLFWPECWPEDTDYVHAGLLVSRGLVPFRDFVSPHFPLLEYILSAVFALFGPSLRAAEILTQIAAAAGSYLVFRAMAVSRGYGPAVAAAAVYGCSSLLFRYHLFEREVFTNVLLAAGLLVVLRSETLSPRRVALLAALGSAAALIKLTALVEWFGLGLFLWIGRRRPPVALRLWAAMLLLVLAAVAAGVTLWGDDFVAQAFVFHTMKGSRGNPAAGLRLLRLGLDLTGALALGGLIVAAAARKLRAAPLSREEGVLLGSLLLVPLAFYGLASPTFWPHNLISVLVPLSWLGAVFLEWWLKAVAQAVRAPDRTAALRAASGLLIMAAGLVVFPIRNDHWARQSAFGFGFQSRREIGEVARAVRAHSEQDRRVIAPPYVAVQANRMKLVHYREVAGPVTLITEAMRAGTLGELRQRLRDRDFFAALFDASRTVGKRLEEAVEGRTVPVVVPDSRAALISETRVRESFLEASGYRLVLTTEHYGVWTIAARERTSPMR